YFNDYIKKNNIKEKDVDSLIRNWYSNIQIASSGDRRSHTPVYTIRFKSYSRQSSVAMLEEYTAYISERVQNQIEASLNHTLRSKKTQLENKMTLLTTEAISELTAQTLKTEIAYKIAKEANITEPVANLDTKDMFSISIGSKALQSKVNILKDLKELELLKPNIISVRAKLSLLEQQNQISDDIDFKPYRFIQYIEEPMYRENPKRSMIVIISTLLGFMVAVGLAYLRKLLK
ncbi:hypothetical protein, partial [Photobacterium minamisatsumaniensis]|uniref:hypothetical protein n=1 Tax=Photobacterium minamisatsumaniensis TaxID=2910233 RepID=UPI003D0992D7